MLKLHKTLISHFLVYLDRRCIVSKVLHSLPNHSSKLTKLSILMLIKRESLISWDRQYRPYLLSLAHLNYR